MKTLFKASLLLLLTLPLFSNGKWIPLDSFPDKNMKSQQHKNITAKEIKYRNEAKKWFDTNQSGTDYYGRPDFENNTRQQSKGEGLLIITCDQEDVDVFNGNIQIAMVGSGETEIKLSGGKHTLILQKKIDYNWIWHQKKTVFVGANSKTKVHFKLKKIRYR
ncbi:MAG: hypothetical protein OIF32_06340 [Campylobacterales bacterium]|nr:hypothetical protein [Campylobacterales bacterium]